MPPLTVRFSSFRAENREILYQRAKSEIGTAP